MIRTRTPRPGKRKSDRMTQTGPSALWRAIKERSCPKIASLILHFFIVHMKEV